MSDLGPEPLPARARTNEAGPGSLRAVRRVRGVALRRDCYPRFRHHERNTGTPMNAIITKATSNTGSTAEERYAL